MQITQEFVKEKLFPKAKAIWERKYDRAHVATQHIFEAFEAEFQRKADPTETEQINQICSELQSYGCDRCRQYEVWCACAC